MPSGQRSFERPLQTREMLFSDEHVLTEQDLNDLTQIPWANAS
jgi:hypothetical protein